MWSNVRVLEILVVERFGAKLSGRPCIIVLLCGSRHSVMQLHHTMRTYTPHHTLMPMTTPLSTVTSEVVSGLAAADAGDAMLEGAR